MSTTTDHRIETSGSVSLAAADDSVQGADVKSMPGGFHRWLRHPTVAADRVDDRGLVGVGVGVESRR
ncbi:hypothetical protein G5C60_04745 [Streptomyces sp. HC44]|uniref:Uncharacterized protein n=1 Tax=Streptomyces scabichelini TaxID=2711217 RepID=A0A6G4UZ99_9ACTN|nr:hypothetical protein [Streptomyces scabichelini]NGO06980.1 hypothetical protein [Streptomyces scabichelini]